MSLFLKNINLKGKTTLITGATKGLGRGTAQAIAEAGGDVIAIGRNQSELNSLGKIIKKLRVKYISFNCDVNNFDRIKNFISKLKKLDILVNNAGIYGPKGFIEKVNWKYWIKTIQVNLFGSIMLCREIMPHFKKRNIGKIIQLSGGGAAAPLPRISGYAVSKVGIVRFIENLSEEVKDYQIDINSVAPGAINTKMLNEVLEAGPKKIGNYAYKKALKQKKLGGSSYDDACDLILFLGSNFSNGISGKLISAIWDDWKNWPKYKSLLAKSDLFTLRRITSKDRGVKWGHYKKKNIYDRSLLPKNKLKK